MRTIRLLLLSFLSLVLLGASAPPSFTPYLVKDINVTPTPADSSPSGFVALRDAIIFNAWNFDRRELWRSDGTVAGTYRLTETGYDEILAVAGRRIFFRTWDSVLGNGVWVTDGTLTGTFYLGPGNDYDRGGLGGWVPRQGLFYFGSSLYGHGNELWRTDGTPGGTYKIADVLPDQYSLVSFQGQLYFSAECALWRSDGTATGTVKVREVCLSSLQAVGPRLVFVGSDSHGSELWSSDGTSAGTRRITDLVKGAGSPEFQDFKVVGKRLFFIATTADRGEELYVTDGTAGGTQRLTWLSDPNALGVFLGSLGDRLFFTADDSTHGVELWASDGTPKGTGMVLDACPGDCSSNPISFLPSLGRAYYSAQDGTHGYEPWTTDGTAQGTHMVADLCPGDCNSWPWLVGASGNHVFFSTEDYARDVSTLWKTDGTAEGTVELAEAPEYLEGGAIAGGAFLFGGEDPNHGRELWRSDGTPEGTGLLVDIADEDAGGSSPGGLMPLGDNLLFFARDGQGAALWRSDGTEAGTTAVKRGLRGRAYSPWTASATRVYFERKEQRGGATELWASDGTEAGTIRVTPDGVSADALSAPVIKLGSRVFFSGRSEDYGAELWITDGTREGTRMVADLRPGPASSSPGAFMVFAGKAWFATHTHLWMSDGTAKGTVPVGPLMLEIQPQTAYAGRLWFTGLNSSKHMELWSTDGTAANTVRIAELEGIGSLKVHAGRLWFLGNGSELWSTDGTAAGTRKLDLPASFDILLSDGVRLYLTSYYQGLWVSDGTAAGTRKISPEEAEFGAVPFAGRLYFYSGYSGHFCVSDGTAAGTGPVRPDGQPVQPILLRLGNRLVAVNYHSELWISDGTAAGTQWLRNLAPTSSCCFNTYDIVKAGPHLFFPGWEAATGTELWAMHE